MVHSRIEIMTPPTQEAIDLTKIIEFMVGAVTFIVAFWKYIDSHFAAQKRDKQEFIVSVVKATMDSCLAEFKSDFHEFKQQTNTQMVKFNDTVVKIYQDNKK